MKTPGNFSDCTRRAKVREDGAGWIDRWEQLRDEVEHYAYGYTPNGERYTGWEDMAAAAALIDAAVLAAREQLPK